MATLSLSLREPWPNRNGSLEELVDQAVEITRLDEGFGGEAERTKQRNWMIRWILRAACEAIIRQGKMPLPLAMNLFAEGRKDDRTPWIPVPPEYVALCAKHGVKPEFAAAAELRGAAMKNPKSMRFISASPIHESDALEDAA